jgi:uncharacterized protein
MTSQFSPLSDDEFEFLDDFLLERIDDDADTQNKDEGVLDISELDGLFTAIVSGPVMIPPSQWLPSVWGDFEPVWDNEKEFEVIFTLMMSHMNGIVSALMEQPESFEPVFVTSGQKGSMIVDEWCEGYARGIALAANEWEMDGLDMKILLAPILAFTEQAGWPGHDFKGAKLRNLQKAITPNVREIHAYWLRRRSAETVSQPIHHNAERVGRNDPCPCGSGKKYKKCCLH